MLNSPQLSNPRAPRAVYLAIGTELTSGQITNRNAAWISKKLESCGIPVAWHLTVPDDRKLMLEAMQFAAGNGSLLFITGGLGPTIDDFTRDVLAEWIKSPLEWHEPSWTRIVERMTRRGLKPSESSKQQAFFPKGSQVLRNREGTADGFLIAKDDLSIVVLPGPPKEIEAVWTDHVEPWIGKTFGSFQPIQPKRWQVLGRSEAEIGDWVEEMVQGTGLITGYRATPPYVEVKIWVPSDRVVSESTIHKTIELIENRLSPWTITRDDEDLLDQFFSNHSGNIRFIDGATSGWLSERIWTWARSSDARMRILKSRQVEMIQVLPPSKEAVKWVHQELNSSSEDWTTLVLGGIDSDQEFPWGMRKPVPGGSQIEVRGQVCPYQSFLRDRQEKYQVEWLFHAVRDLS